MSEALPETGGQPDAIEFKHDLSKLQDAAEDLASTRTIEHDERKHVSFAAHRLAYALEQAGLSEAATRAYSVAATLDHAGLPQPERLQEQVQALAALLNASH